MVAAAVMPEYRLILFLLQGTVKVKDEATKSNGRGMADLKEGVLNVVARSS
jgi:hypothetical protein